MNEILAKAKWKVKWVMMRRQEKKGETIDKHQFVYNNVKETNILKDIYATYIYKYMYTNPPNSKYFNVLYKETMRKTRGRDS